MQRGLDATTYTVQECTRFARSSRPFQEACALSIHHTGSESSPPTKYSVRSCVPQDRQITPQLLQGIQGREAARGKVQLNFQRTTDTSRVTQTHS